MPTKAEKQANDIVVGCPNCKHEFDPALRMPHRCPQCGFVNHPVRMTRAEWDQLDGYGEQGDPDEPFYGM